MHILEQLENPEYLEANGISPEEVPELKKVAEELVVKSQDEEKPFIEYKLRNRQEAQIFVTRAQADLYQENYFSRQADWLPPQTLQDWEDADWD